MKSIANENEKLVIEVLVNQIKALQWTSGQAWSCFSQPEQIKKIKQKGGDFYIKFTEVEFQALKNLKGKLISHLDSEAGRRCAYCKRAMGKHGYSWHIEHIRCKSKFPADTFNLKNLTFACVDCNMAKNHNLDNKAAYVYDIIDPNSPGFKYSKHIKYIQISTETIHVLKYHNISPEGKKTHLKLKFATLERCITLSSLNRTSCNLLNTIDDTMSKLEEDGLDDLGKFLFQLKGRIFSH